MRTLRSIVPAAALWACALLGFTLGSHCGGDPAPKTSGTSASLDAGVPDPAVAGSTAQVALPVWMPNGGGAECIADGAPFVAPEC